MKWLVVMLLVAVVAWGARRHEVKSKEKEDGKNT
jgi:hypothetical protein